MGTKIKFRGQYEPYLITGEAPYDPRPYRASKGPRPKGSKPSNLLERMCSSCSTLIHLGDLCYRTRKGTWRHDQCPY